jgi:hypothetical protein
LPENTAEGDPAVFFVCHEKTQKSSGAVLCFPAKGYAAAPNGAHLCQKADVFFVFSAN